MEYPQQAWLSFLLSALAAYALGGWIYNGTASGGYQTGEGTSPGPGSYCREENGKPYNSGDAVSGM